MSIIYDALKKVEGAKDPLPASPQPANKPDKSKFKAYLSYFFVICAGFLIANMAFTLIVKSARVNDDARVAEALLITPNNTVITQEPKRQDHLPAKIVVPAATPPISLGPYSKPDTKPINLALNGIFFSQDEGYALINNRILKEGDKIENATITRITAEEVELNNNGLPVKLSTRK